MALRALDVGVPSLQWIRGGSMLFHGEGGGFPVLHVVTGGALATICALDELSLVRVLVTIHALCKCQRFFEIAVGVTLSATYCRVLAFEWELCPGVIKALVHRL